MKRKILFVHGFLGFGSPLGGAAYWRGTQSDFVVAAQAYFDDDTPPFFSDFEFNYANIFAASKQIHFLGYYYARVHYNEITAGLLRGRDMFDVVSHSLGGAFSEGMMHYLAERKWQLATAVYMNVWNPAGRNTPRMLQRPVKIIDATINNDWVQGLSVPLYGKRNIPGANVRVRKTSQKGFRYRHRDLIDCGGEFWKVLLPEVEQHKNGLLSLNQSKNFFR
jgi:hypothetical protein